MPYFRSAALAARAALVFSAIVLTPLIQAAPLIPLSAIGTGQAITVSTTGRIEILAGGLYTGTIEGSAAYFWCTDGENEISLPASYRGNVTLLYNWVEGVNGEVQKGTDTSPLAWTFPGNPFLTPLMRYQAAAYLITRMQAYQAGVDVSGDDDYQLAIWSLLDLTPDPDTMLAGGSAAEAYRTSAVDYVIANPAYGFGHWAVVSGAAGLDGGLIGKDRVQTFLTEVQPIPEPSSYLLMGAGLLSLAYLSRRAKT